jgi:hypothetical protein
MATKDNKSNKKPVDSGQFDDLEKIGHQRDDMLNLEKGAAEMDSIKGELPKVEGGTISGTGTGPGTGETSDDFYRPYSEGEQAQNDFVSKEPLPKETNQANPERVNMEKNFAEQRNDPEGAHEGSAGPSGYPGGGAARDSSDKLPPEEHPDVRGWTPASPVQQPKTNEKKASR